MTHKQKAARWAELRAELADYRGARFECSIAAMKNEQAGEYDRDRMRRVAMRVAELVDRLDGKAP